MWTEQGQVGGSSKAVPVTQRVSAALALIAAILSTGACGPRHAMSDKPPELGATSHVVTGRASWYGPGFAGRLTANGERFDPNALTCAHRTLPFGTRLRVTNVENAKTVEVRVNDRGPFAKGRILDLSQEAARRLGMIERGEASVRIEILR